MGTLQQTYINTGFNLTPTSMQTQKPFGGDNWSNTTLTTKESTLLNWIGQEKDNESNLGDHGVRKYEYETGRFISIDPLWSKYYGWTPYQYSMNSPVIVVDVGGQVVIKQNLTESGSNGFDKVTNFLANLKSPTINGILTKVNGPSYKIYVNSFSENRSSVNTNTKSNVGRSGTLESEWKTGNKAAAGMTLQPSDPNSLSADIILSSESLDDVSNNEGFNVYETATVSIIDEFHHSLNRSTTEIEHSDLQDAIQKEWDSGIFNGNSEAEKYIPWLIQRMEDQKNK